MIPQVRKLGDWIRMMEAVGIQNWWQGDIEKYYRIKAKLKGVLTAEEYRIFKDVYVDKEKNYQTALNRKPWYFYKVLNILEYKILRIYNEEFPPEEKKE